MTWILRACAAHAAAVGGATAILVASILGQPACLSHEGALPASATTRGTSPAHGDTVGSNVTREDYAGSASCEPCHASIFAAWQASPMHRMTRDARAARVRAPFDGTRWRFKDDTVVLDRRGDDRLVRVQPAGARPVTYRVTRVIGGRTREDFAGIDLAGGSEELVLPVSYVFATGSLRYKGYSVMVRERATLRAGPVWSRACIFCHNTVPELDRLLGAIAGPGARLYQGEQVDGWLPSERRSTTRVTDEANFARAVADEELRLGAPSHATGSTARVEARDAIEVVRGAFDGEDVVEVGIGCEACHGGSREHAHNPTLRPSLAPVATWLDARFPPVSSTGSASGAPAFSKVVPAASVTNHVCARCHQVLFSRYPFTWEGGRRDHTAGGSHINSGEGRDFMLGACSGSMACTTCHDPHAGGSSDPSQARGASANVVCTACHAQFASSEQLRAHAHHDPTKAAGSCVACHMPRKNMGLDGELTRYHRIGSPTDPARVLGDRPLECALCHSDRSVGTLVDAMERWWPVRYPRQRFMEMYGSLDANVMRATLDRGKPHEQAVAMATLASAGAQDAVPAIARELLNDYPLVREWARRALVSLLGRCDVDLSSDDATIARQAAACAGGPVPLRPTAASDEDAED
jgi:hypothetical protein